MHAMLHRTLTHDFERDRLRAARAARARRSLQAAIRRAA
jgi:hypothetical protein